MRTDAAFWRGKRVLLTGHTGFKGNWASVWLASMDAEVTGFALAPATQPAMFEIVQSETQSIIGDLRDLRAVENAVAATQPEIVLHLAAQPLVRYSYDNPVETFDTNIMGTVHLLDALRRAARARVILIVTTDKVYENDESGRAFSEDDRLGGHDPYAASKAATEIAVSSYRRSFFGHSKCSLATARGGNVIGGGDFSNDRLVPDFIRAVQNGQEVALRNPSATRPWQHVLDCLDGYFTYMQALYDGTDVPEALNIGPHDPADTRTVAEVAAAMSSALGTVNSWTPDQAEHPHEMAALALDPSAAREHLGWQGRLTSAQAIRLTADWYGAWVNGAAMTRFTHDQIEDYQAGKETTP